MQRQESHRKPAGKGHFLLNKPMSSLKLSVGADFAQIIEFA